MARITVTMINNKNPEFSYNEKSHRFLCQGVWSIHTVAVLHTRLPHIELPKDTKLEISGAELSYFDSAGALALQNFINTLQKQCKEIQLTDFSEQQTALLQLIKTHKETLEYHPKPPEEERFLYRLGEETTHKIEQVTGFMGLMGDITDKLMSACRHWRKFRAAGILSNVDSAGLQALPIVALLSFLIGVVLAYQMGLQLQTYGANIFIAYLSGMAILREFSPLITAIIVAGRTSSAYTAQLGSMKVNEEIDALQTMGMSPVELLVLPKIIGLTFVFPLLIFWSDLWGLLGAMVMSKSMLGIGYLDFLARLKDSVGLQQLMLGLYKAPAFAIIIAMVGCFQGFAVLPNADSIGSQTTKSVVQALFLIIIADASFSVAYSWMGL